MAIGKMDYEQVEKVSQGFSDASDFLKAVDTALEALLIVLRTTAFIGMVGGAAVERYISNIKPHVEKLAAKSEEFAADLKQAIANHQQAESETRPDFND
jgi:hypothetical protein